MNFKPLPGFYAHILIVALFVLCALVSVEPQISRWCAQLAGIWLFVTLVGYIFDLQVRNYWLKKSKQYKKELNLLKTENEFLKLENELYKERLIEFGESILVTSNK